MSVKVKNFIKKAIISLLCAASVANMMLTGIPLVTYGSGSSDILGTNQALGSPILNERATTDNWNKWEMVCWGVFLSNFCQPLIDTYETAFSTSSNGGSQGAGYKALCFGSGSDPENNEVIKNFTSFAIQSESSAELKNIYVAYTHVSYDGTKMVIDDKPDPNSVDDATSVLRAATLDDFFFKYDTSVEEGKTNVIFGNKGTSENYSAVAYISDGYIPTFYVKSATKSGKYAVILDYMNSWDLQSFSAMINGIRTDTTSQDYKKMFTDKLDNLYGTGAAVGMDCFGNLVLSDHTMVMPAAVNQNITTEKSINILNSWMMNSYVSNYSKESILEDLHQSRMDDGFVALIDGFGQGGSTDLEYAGLPAFGDSDIDGAGFFYYDTDAAALLNETGTTGKSFSTFRDYMYALFDADITSDSNKLPLEYEVAGVNSMSYVSWADNTSNSKQLIESTIMCASTLVNYVHHTETKKPEMLTKLINTDGTKVSLIGDSSIVVPVQVVTPSEDSFSKNGKSLRNYYNWVYQVYSGNISDSTAGIINSTKLQSELSDSHSVSDFKDVSSDKLWEFFTSCNSAFRDVDIPSGWSDIGNNESIQNSCSRLVKVYPSSQIMQTVSAVLNVADGTEFKTYSTMIYMTYLDWYGVVNKSTLNNGTESQSKFNEEIYDPTSDLLNTDPGDITTMMSEEDLESEVLNLGYLMLSPEAGRSYRKQMVYNGIADFLYEQYNRIVYGGSSSVYSGSSTKSNSGFLAVPTFSENFLTSWFLDSYIDISVVMIIVCTILLIIIGLLKGRKFSWFILGIFTVVNVILLVPSSGEITPAVTTNFTQKIFSSKMTYWTLSEGIANASIESDAASKTNDFEGLSDEEASVVRSLINQLSVVYTDRSLMLKQDVSQKLTQAANDSIYAEVQSIPSARWVLPMVMQQFSARDQDSGKYVYVKLSNVWDDGSNLYWYYKPIDASSVTKSTATSQQFTTGDATVSDEVTDNGNGGRNKYSDASTTGSYISANFYTDYKDATWADDTSTTMNYACYAYTLNDDPNLNAHLYSYILHDPTLNMNSTTLSRENIFGAGLSNYKNVDSWQTWIDTANSTLQQNTWKTDKDSYYAYEEISDQYDRTQTGTLHDGYGYYKTTESPYYYFFNVVKDSFPYDKTVGSLIGRLQGKIEKNSVGDDVRSNFMYATMTTNKEKEGISGNVTNSDVVYTGFVRDVLDLQELFTNTVPYMYEMTIAAGGFDGESGILSEEVDGKRQGLKITDGSDYYEGNLQSWAYRCNWAVKLMENNNYSKPSSAKLPDGTKVTIQNPMLPECYEAAGRQMVFSEAQKEAYGLKDGDLTLVELKCIEVNKNVARDWTMLVNYAGTSGLTKEVMFRVMATDATEEFCKEFSTSGVLDTRYEIYPQSVDLRYLSFDAIMKMLMINVSKNTSYAYGDTMSTLLTDSDLFTAFMLLLCAVLCVWLIPLCQQIIMAAIFYLGFIAIIRALFSSAAYKGKVAGAQLVSNVVFMLYTIAYYLLISMLMSLSSSDEVLSVKSVTTNPGNPVWMLLAVIVLSCVYVFLMYKHLCFCFAHYRDMGAEMVGFVTSTIVGKLQDFAGNVRDGITSLASGDDTHSGGSGGTESMSGTGVSDTATQNVNIQQANDSSIKITKDTSDSDNVFADENAASAYNTGDTLQSDSSTTAADIDAEIKAGEQLGSDS